MGDTVFHIVENNDGEIEIVQLAPVKLKVNSKLNTKELVNPEFDSNKEKKPYIKVKNKFKINIFSHLTRDKN